MKIATVAFSFVLFASSSVWASDLNLSVKSGGQNIVKVAPGATVSYQVVGELSDGFNQGLAMFAFNLSFNGGALNQASAPSSSPMNSFATPLGLNNPAGFGGTVIGGNLIQVGGAQNTINNFIAPFPSGSVLLGVALPGTPVTLASGTLTAPSQFGTYTLSLSSLLANAVRQGETGIPFWHVDPVNAGTVTNLTVEVDALFANTDTISVSTPGGTQTLSLNAGASNAGRIYWLLGSVSGTTPGIQVKPSVHLPLNYDAYMQFTVSNPNSPLLTPSVATLDGLGKATATFHLPHVSSSLVGITANHAFLLLQPMDFASNAVSMTLVP